MSITTVQRIGQVDALRGFALLGILIVNSSAFASTYYGTGAIDPVFLSPIDHLARRLITVAFESKFYVLFSFLFGYSFTLQIASADRVGAAPGPRMWRRLAGLFAIGAAHAVLLFHGDILTTYAILGLVLLAWRELSRGEALRRAAFILIATATCYATLGVLEQIGGSEPLDVAAISEQAMRATSAYQGGAASVITQRMSDLPPTLFGVVWFTQAPAALAMFLLGLAAGKARLFERIEQHRPLLRRIVVAGGTAGLAGSLWQTDGHVPELFALAVNTFTGPLLSGAYAAVLLLALETSVGHRIGLRLRRAGQTALSNYLLQSAACAFIFTGYGLGLTGRVSPLSALYIAFAIFGLQLVASDWWLRCYQYGPVEWLLRAITYAEWPNWRARSGTT